MPEELVPARRRKAYEPERHCGAPVNRDPDHFREMIAKTQRVVDEIQQKPKLTPFDKRRLRDACRSLAFRTRSLQKILDLGPDSRPCVKGKGQGTDHPGAGLCRFHCVCKGKDGGHLSYYSRKARDTKLADLIEEMERSNMDVLNLEPDVIMMRGKIKLFLDAKPDFDPETVKSITLLVEMLRKLVETINDKRFRSMITLEMFQVMQHRMGEVVARIVTDQEQLEAIMHGWAKIAVDGAEKRIRTVTNHALTS